MDKRVFPAVKLSAVLAVLALTMGSQWTVGADAPKKDPRRAFYLTPERHDGSQALNACADGYHMASIWEMLDPSNLRYDSALGVTAPDSGSGPPVIQFGWVRTGRNASRVSIAGVANCSAWTSNATDDPGTAVMLPGIWQGETANSPIEPWSATAASCASPVQVWCVED